jgi:tetratricopeptide (TPR) repeat protein
LIQGLVAVNDWGENGWRVPSALGQVFERAYLSRCNMPGRSFLRTSILILTVAWPACRVASGASPQAPANLVEAVAARSPFHAERHLKGGESPDQLLGGEPLLVHAVRGGNLELCRVLLLNGADVQVTGKGGEALARLVPPDSDDSLVLTFLIRTYQMLDKYARKRDRPRPERPNLVVVFEPIVDYDHPALAPFYYINRRELGGRDNTDDDEDSFIDNVYGWSAVLDRPFQLNLAQRRTWGEYRSLIHELADLNNRLETGEISWLDPQVLKLSNSYRNPIAALFGNRTGCTDREFLDRIVEVSHGTHVAGTVVRASDGRALLHTITWRGFGETPFPANPLPAVVDGDPDRWLRAFQTNSFADRIATGRRGSDYLRAIECGVVNGSFGNSFDAHVAVAGAIWNEMALINPDLSPAALEVIAQEMYAFESIPYVIAAAENPDILFVVSAGNDSRDNDISNQTPGILSRFFPNVITIAASDPTGDKALFSNYGRKGVTLAAPGEKIESDGVAGCRLLMSGTSMSAPHVSGAIARIRADHPDLSGVEISHLAQLGVSDPLEKWSLWTTAGGILDANEMLAVIEKRPEALRRMAWRMYGTDPDLRPEVWVTGLNQLRQVAAANPYDPLLLQSLAAVYDKAELHREAVSAIEQAIAQDPSLPAFWHGKCLVHHHAREYDEVLRTSDEFAKRFQENGEHLRLHAEVLEMAMDAATKKGDESLRGRLNKSYREALAGLKSFSGEPVMERESGLQRAKAELTDEIRSMQFTVRGKKDDFLIADLESAAFDTILTVKGPDMLEWKNDDREEDIRHSRLEITLPADGEYLVIVDSYDSTATGEFELTLRGASATLERFREPLRHWPPGSR